MWPNNTHSRKKHVVSVALLLAMAAPLVNALPSPGPMLDLWGLSEYYVDFEIVALDPSTVRSDVEDDGRTILQFYGQAFAVTVTEAPWSPMTTLGRLSADRTVVEETLSFPMSAHLGSVDGIEGSDVLLSITEVGVAGFLDLGDQEFGFYPVKTHNGLAPAGLSVVFPSHAVIIPDLPHDDSLLMDDVEAPGTLPAEGGIGVASHEPGPDRKITLHADFDLSQTVGWEAKVWNAYTEVNGKYDGAMAGFSFFTELPGGPIYYCDSDACDESWGMNKVDGTELLQTWGANVRDFNPTTFEFAALTKGGSISGAQGVGWQSGRYSATKATGISDAVYAKVLAHEIGHNFNGDHGKRSGTFPGRATDYQHDHGFNHVHTTNHCHLYVPLTTICLDNHQHNENHWHNDWYTHWTIMNYPGSGSKDEWVYEFSGGGTAGNYYWVRSCNYNSWSEGNQNSQNDPGTGFYCTN